MSTQFIEFVAAQRDALLPKLISGELLIKGDGNVP